MRARAPCRSPGRRQVRSREPLDASGKCVSRLPLPLLSLDRTEAGKDVEQLVDFLARFAAIAGCQRIRHTGLDVRLKDHLPDRIQGSTHRGHLQQQVHAIAILGHHPLNSSHLARDAAQASLGLLLDFWCHGLHHIPPRGILSINMTQAFDVISPATLAQLMSVDPLPLLLDVRRRSAFGDRPVAIAGAVALLLDEDPIRVPDVPRDRPVVLYCLCRGEASSSRAARWLLQNGHRRVMVLRGGLGAWVDDGQPVEPIHVERGRSPLAWKPLDLQATSLAQSEELGSHDDPFHSSLEQDTFLRGRQLPMRRVMSVLFVDMTDSTRLFASLQPEEVLRLVQLFMEVVVEVGVLHCGDVHDFEGDGALLYFEGVGESLPAAFEIRERLRSRREQEPRLSLPRISLDVGELVIGIVGGRFRRTVALVGVCVPRAARILKLGPPGGIVATEQVIDLARESNPDLAAAFKPIDSVAPLKGLEGENIRLFSSE